MGTSWSATNFSKSLNIQYINGKITFVFLILRIYLLEIFGNISFGMSYIIWKYFPLSLVFQARNLKHNPETYMQFSSLALKPPSTSKDIPDLLEKLKSKKVSNIYFERFYCILRKRKNNPKIRWCN